MFAAAMIQENISANKNRGFTVYTLVDVSFTFHEGYIYAA